MVLVILMPWIIKQKRGWAKSSTSLLRVRVNISAQWLIGRFVRVLHSKSDLINCAGVGRRTLFLTSRVLSRSLQIEEKVHFGQFSSIFFLYVENKKLSEMPKYQCF
ncbi:hypothetical protein CWM22_02455 [Streptococcus suis]|nr:hypothetical protein CWM22_02455 [Streptococcus suis]